MDKKDTTKINVLDIEALLPQTQCKKCGYNGCLPYAEAIVCGESVNKCSPGGDAVIEALTDLTGDDLLPLDKNHLLEFPAHIVRIDEFKMHWLYKVYTSMSIRCNYRKCKINAHCYFFRLYWV